MQAPADVARFAHGDIMLRLCASPLYTHDGAGARLRDIPVAHRRTLKSNFCGRFAVTLI
ncbi:hypothetical protein RTE01_41570 [Raoultella terrigena]|nr:hypothetical protein RTE01_41570 [Raoultella terrigena]